MEGRRRRQASTGADAQHDDPGYTDKDILGQTVNLTLDFNRQVRGRAALPPAEYL